MTVAQICLVVLWACGANWVYFHVFPARKMLLVYGSQMCIRDRVKVVKGQEANMPLLSKLANRAYGIIEKKVYTQAAPANYAQPQAPQAPQVPVQPQAPQAPQAPVQPQNPQNPTQHQ